MAALALAAVPTMLLLDKERTRKSMVFHYYAKDVICYHEITQRPTLKKA